MTKFAVLTAPDPRLIAKAEVVKSVTRSTRILMKDMLDTMYEGKGVGLAANQVGVLQRVLVIDLQGDDDIERPKGFYPLFIVNPKILERSEILTRADEGCMSIPKQILSVNRPQSVKVRYLNYNNETQELESNGWLARVLQHEIDHLDGRLMIDYLSKLKKDVVLRRILKAQRLMS